MHFSTHEGKRTKTRPRLNTTDLVGWEKRNFLIHDRFDEEMFIVTKKELAQSQINALFTVFPNFAKSLIHDILLATKFDLQETSNILSELSSTTTEISGVNSMSLDNAESLLDDTEEFELIEPEDTKHCLSASEWVMIDEDFCLIEQPSSSPLSYRAALMKSQSGLVGQQPNMPVLSHLKKSPASYRLKQRDPSPPEERMEDYMSPVFCKEMAGKCVARKQMKKKRRSNKLKA